MRIPRGGPTAIAGFLFLLLGFVATYVGASGTYLLLSGRVQNAWIPIPASAVDGLYLTALAAGAAAAIGGILIAIARAERDREEENVLDPLAYAPVRTVRKRAALYATFGVLVIAVPAGLFLPVAHSVTLTVPVGTCPSAPTDVQHLSLPDYAILTYSWRTANGEPITLLIAPSGPVVFSGGLASQNFTESSAGWSELTANGTALAFAACDTPADQRAYGPTNVSVAGTYYTTLL
ncbi:MAG TPA: hypothetical protein VMH90_02930 [Thermoplasmata archaeon]|nr:hypothetical protein [Thermoplasmata archaeon]